MRNRFLLFFAMATAIALPPNLAGAITFFTEDFESYAMDPDVVGVGGWEITNTSAVIEIEAQWHLVDTKNTAAGFLLPSTVNFGPATTGGLTTPGFDSTGALPGGLYLMSFSDELPVGLFPTFPAGTVPESEIHNATYSGASNDIVSPSFSTATATGDVWLHTSVSANLNDNGQAYFDIDVSTNGGATWTNKFRRISPGAGRNIASGDFDSDVDVDGSDFLSQQRSFDPTTVATLRASNQRFSDWNNSYQGAYTPLVATVGAGDSGGYHGELDLNLGNLGGAADVKVRFRHRETRDDEQIAIDNIVVNEEAPLGSGPDPIYLEDFNSLSLGSMGVYTFVNFFGSFGFDSGGGSGTISGNSWGAQDRDSVEFPTGRYNAGSVGPKGVNHLGHPTAEGLLGQVPFAIIDPKAEEDNVDPFDNIQSERLHTPLLALSGYDSVILEWDSETIFGGNPAAGSVASVVLMEDTDSNGPDDGDLIIAEPDKLVDFFDPFTPYDQLGGGLFAGSDDPIFMHHRLDITSLVNSVEVTDKDKLYIAFQFFSADTDYWAIDNVRLTGTLTPPALAANVPEPSSLLLIMLGVPVFGAFRRRRTIG